MTALDFSADQALFDNLESVTFTSVRRSGNQTVTGITDATFDFVGIREAAQSGGVYQAGDVSFSIRQSLLNGVGGAKPGDQVTRASDGQTYTVLSAIPTVMTRVWDLTCRNLILAADLRSTGTLSRPELAQDSAGRPALASYTDVAADIPCRVQPEGGSATETFGRVTMPKRYTAYLGVQVDARAKDRFVSDGVTYTVLEMRAPERIDQLMSLTLEKVL
ncbi:MAG TPA: hypothetical protein VGE74_28220 [Gemmata sp.]